MKLWHIAAIAAVLGIAYVLISRPKVPNPGASPYTSNAPYIGLATSLANLGTSIFNGGSKAVAPSAIPPDTASWNNVSASDLDALRAGDTAAGVEGPF
jgi:ammonia channel protein AmtB